MRVQMPRMVLEIAFEEAAREYLSRLPLEHFMESTPQATQREITLESLALVKAQRADVHVFNELLVQYRLPRRKKLGQVVPDNMVVVHDGRIKARGSYDVPLQPVGPFWVLEYVSPRNARKDYVENRVKYEFELQVRYYLLFAPESQVLSLYRHTGKRYLRVRPNAEGRCEITELELEVGLHDGWMRYWFRGKLLPLPAEMLREHAEDRRALAEERQGRAEERRARVAAEQEAARLRAELERLKKANTKRSGPNGET
jgi:Uma2 family endonuclease